MPASDVLIGVVSDTHGHLDDRLIAAFQGVDAILHAGDVGSEMVLESLRQFAPVHAVQGNNDAALGGLGLPAHLDLTFGGVQVHVVHELPDARPAAQTGVVIFGHSHRQLREWRDGVLFLNPGAPAVRASTPCRRRRCFAPRTASQRQSSCPSVQG